jgi:hypothetical protein
MKVKTSILFTNIINHGIFCIFSTFKNRNVILGKGLNSIWFYWLTVCTNHVITSGNQIKTILWKRNLKAVKVAGCHLTKTLLYEIDTISRKIR